MSLGIVDTPGLGDTAGKEQDARNLASIQKFIVEKNGRKPPNLVMLLLRADGNRDIGPDSKLANCIRVFLQSEEHSMGLTQSGQNVIIVMTHALNISHHDDRWTKLAKEKVTAVKNFVYQQTKWNIPVVLLENDAPNSRMKKQGDWTVLPNKQHQPKNLFDEITRVLKQRQDSQCQIVVNSYFARSQKDSAVTVRKGPSVLANLEGLNTSQERSFHQLISYSYTTPTDTQESSLDTAAQNVEPGDSFEFNAYKEQDPNYDNHSAHTLKTAGSTVKETTEGMLIGKGYTIKCDGEILDCQIFDEQMISDKIQRLFCSRTEWRPLESFNRVGIFRNRNLSSGFSYAGNSSFKEVSYTDSKVLKVALMKVVPSEDLKALWTERAYLSSGFLGDLDKLPTKYDEKTKKKFTKFFKNRGQAFVSKGYYGGEIRLKIPGRYFGLEDDSSGGEVPVNCLPFKAQMQLSNSNMYKDLSVIVIFRGGSHACHHYRCQKNQDEWQKSVSEAPEEIILMLNRTLLFTMSL